MKKRIITIGVIIAAISGILIVLNKNKAKNAAQVAVVAQKNNGVTVRTAAASFKDLAMTYAANGVFAPKQEVIISTETPGRISRVLVKEGAMVRAGQTLAIIEGDRQNVALSNAQAVYNNALSEVSRFENAYASGGVTKQQLDQIKLQLENAKNNLRSAQIGAVDVNVKASFSGIVNKKLVEEGSYVNPGNQLFEIVNIGSLKLKTNVDEKTVGTLKLGQKVSIESNVFPGKRWESTVTFIAPKADASLNFPVELEINNNSNNELKAGMYGTAKFGDDEMAHALVIPRNAFVGSISSNKVFVAQNGKAVLKEVVAGRNFGDWIEVISGIASGETVITSGQINLLNNSLIQIIQ